MVATSDLGSDAERRGGSSPFVRTKSDCHLAVAFLRPKGLAKQSFATPFIFTIPPNLPLRREAYGKCPTCSPSVNTYYQHSALALLNAVRVPGSAPGWLVVYLQTLQNVDLSSYKNFLIALYFFAIKNRVRVYQHKIFLLTFAVELEWWC